MPKLERKRRMSQMRCKGIISPGWLVQAKDFRAAKQGCCCGERGAERRYKWVRLRRYSIERRSGHDARSNKPTDLERIKA